MAHPVRSFHYGNRLKQLVGEKTTVSDFADKMEVSRPSVYDWFNKKHFEDEFLDKIYPVLDLTDDIFFAPVGKYKTQLFIEQRIEAIEQKLETLKLK